jgi:hypothetical protein
MERSTRRQNSAQAEAVRFFVILVLVAAAFRCIDNDIHKIIVGP